MTKIDAKGMIKPKFSRVEFDGIGMHANVQRLKGKQS